MGGAQPRDPVAGGIEEDGISGVGGLDSESDRDVCLADARRTEQDDVLRFGNEHSSRQVRQHITSQARQVVEIEVFERFHYREVRRAYPYDRARRLTIGELAAQYRCEVFLV